MNNFLEIKRNSQDISKYTIYGERHSGTKLLQKIITSSTTLNINWNYGYKHWFGFTDKGLILDAQDTLFFGIVRNPYDWLLSFYKEPHHVPINNRVPIGNFLFNEWYSVQDYVFNNTEILQDRNFISGHRYKNIFDLRSHKIYYIRQVLPILCRNLVLLRYEDLVSNTVEIISGIKALLNHSQRKQKNSYYIKSNKTYECSSLIKNMIDYHIDWDIEHTVGYHRIN